MKTKILKKYILGASKILFWFSVGAGLGLFLFLSFAFILFQNIYNNTVYPDVIVENLDLGGKTAPQVREIFAQKNEKLAQTQFAIESGVGIATISASQIDYGYDEALIATQAISVGRSKNIFSDISLVVQAYLKGIRLQPSYHYSEAKLLTILDPIIKELYIEPIDAVFKFENGRVTTFKQSSNGKAADIETLKNDIATSFAKTVHANESLTITIPIHTKILEPNITTEKVNDLGIKELIAQGTSYFKKSIPNRIYNITLAASRLNGILVEPNETFSFNTALGDISAFTGYKQAYVIQNGRTILGDGGGVCQVSTTFFRALLNSGLPIVERHAHSYRVGYYEQDSPPGFDATIYIPSVDLRFKNDTGNHILVQSSVDTNAQKLTFSLFGTSDGRSITITKPLITKRIAPPEPLYQDDPNLPKGQTKQIEYAAEGARVSLSREVTKDGEVILSDTFNSNFQPWQAVYLRGTKE